MLVIRNVGGKSMPVGIAIATDFKATAWSIQLKNCSTAASSPQSAQDIDIVVEYPVTSAELRTLTPSSPILRLLQGPLTKAEFECDAYPLYSLPEDDPAYEKVTAGGLRYWMKWFGRTRLGVEKGRIWTTVGGFDERT
jgi:hypothetical protein